MDEQRLLEQYAQILRKEETELRKNTKEQYEELGRFIVSFEAMVNNVRELCIYLLAYDPGLIFGAEYTSRQNFVSVAMHHGAMTAKPLFEILQCLIAEIANDKNGRKNFNIDDEIQSLFSGVLTVINKEYADLTKKRNNLLHATWYIGFSGASDPEAKEFFVNKLTTSKTGLTSVALPKTAEELRALTGRCLKTSTWLLLITAGFFAHEKAARLKSMFRHNGTKWVAINSDGDEETLP